MMTFGLILEYRETVTQKDIYGGNTGSIGRWAGALPGGAIGFGIGHQFDDPTSKDHIYGNIGGYIGTSLGAAFGGQIGKYLGQSVAPDPDSAADFNNPLHRTGYLAMPSISKHGFISDLFLPPPVTSIASNVYNAVSDNGVKKLGYEDPVSRIAEVGAGPFLGLVPPKKLKKIIKRISS